MNDDDLTTLLKEPFADAHMTMPLDQVARRGRAVRTHRRLLRGLTGAVALAGTAAAAVALLVPGGYPVPAKLAAWTVTREAGGGIKVTINQMKDPGGLQATLRADGIPASVTFNSVHAMSPPLPAGCTAPDMSDRANTELQSKILSGPIWSGHGPAFYIKPAAIPAGIGLYLGVDVASRYNWNLGEALVVTSPQCTGS